MMGGDPESDHPIDHRSRNHSKQKLESEDAKMTTDQPPRRRTLEMLSPRNCLAGSQLPNTATASDRQSMVRNRSVGKVNTNGISVKRLNCSVNVLETAKPVGCVRRRGDGEIGWMRGRMMLGMT